MEKKQKINKLLLPEHREQELLMKQEKRKKESVAKQQKLRDPANLEAKLHFMTPKSNNNLKNLNFGKESSPDLKPSLVDEV